MSWFTISKEGDRATIWIRDEIDASQRIDFAKEIGDAPKLEIFIDSIGGATRPAIALYEIIKERDAEAWITGRCFSAATIPAMGCMRVRMARQAQFMIHSSWAHHYGNAEKLRTLIDEILNDTEKLVRIYSGRTGCTHDRIRSWLQADTYFSAESARRAGFVDEIYDLPSRPVCFDKGAIQAGSFPACDESKSRLFLEVLKAFGPIETGDAEKLLRDVRYWALTNIKQFEPSCAAPMIVAEASPHLLAA